MLVSAAAAESKGTNVKIPPAAPEVSFKITWLVTDTLPASVVSIFATYLDVALADSQPQESAAGNVVFVPHSKVDVVVAIKRALFDAEYRDKISVAENPYGDGHTGEKIAKILSKIEINDNLIKKQITY